MQQQGPACPVYTSNAYKQWEALISCHSFYQAPNNTSLFNVLLGDSPDETMTHC